MKFKSKLGDYIEWKCSHDFWKGIIIGFGVSIIVGVLGVVLREGL